MIDRFAHALGVAWRRLTETHERRLAGYGRTRRALGRFSYLLNGVFASLGALLFLLVLASLVFGMFAAFIEKLVAYGWRRDLVGALALAATSFVLLKFHEFLWFVTRAVGAVSAKCVYYASWMFFCIVCPAAFLSMLMRLGDGLGSFLTAPIGIKPDYVELGFGALAGTLLTLAVASGVLLFLMSKLKASFADKPSRVRLGEQPVQQ